MEFFDKTKWTISKLTDSPLVKPDVQFSLNIKVMDQVKLVEPLTISGKLVKVSGRNKTELTATVSIVRVNQGTYTVTATPTALEWNGTDGLNLQFLVNSTDSISLPLVVTQ